MSTFCCFFQIENCWTPALGQRRFQVFYWDEHWGHANTHQIFSLIMYILTLFEPMTLPDTAVRQVVSFKMEWNLMSIYPRFNSFRSICQISCRFSVFEITAPRFVRSWQCFCVFQMLVSVKSKWIWEWSQDEATNLTDDSFVAVL